MSSIEKLLQFRTEGEMQTELKKKAHKESEMLEFEKKLTQVIEKLDMRLRVAARLQYLELKLIGVNKSALVDLNKVVWIDNSRRNTSGDSWASVHPYQDKAVIRHPGLLSLWEKLESYGLRPIFIEGPYGAPIFGVQLPDGGIYPRSDSAEVVAFRTLNRMDSCLNEDGSISFMAPRTI